MSGGLEIADAFFDGRLVIVCIALRVPSLELTLKQSQKFMDDCIKSWETGGVGDLDAEDGEKI